MGLRRLDGGPERSPGSVRFQGALKTNTSGIARSLLGALLEPPQAVPEESEGRGEGTGAPVRTSGGLPNGLKTARRGP